MNFEKVAFYSQVGLKYNEDRGYATSNYGWVIDGATGLGGVHITEGDTDAAWFAEAVHTELKARIDSYEGSIPALLEEIGEVVKQKFYTYEGSTNLAEEALPSAGICMVRVIGDKLHYYTLGDCTLLIKGKDGTVQRIYDDRVSHFDGAATKAMIQVAKEKNIDMLDAREHINETLIANRRMKNKPDGTGYYCFTIENNQFNQGLSGVIGLEEIDALAIMSDGYAQYYDTLHCIDDEKEMMEALRIKGLEVIAQEIKETQNEDARANKYPRFKVSDDMTVVYMTR